MDDDDGMCRSHPIKLNFVNCNFFKAHILFIYYYVCSFSFIRNFKKNLK
jgi:hypothetical protein